MMKREEEKFVFTDDDFCGNYEGSRVLVKLTALNPDGELWRVGAWGSDDFGMVCDGLSYEVAKEIYDQMPEPILIEQLGLMGFVVF